MIPPKHRAGVENPKYHCNYGTCFLCIINNTTSLMQLFRRQQPLLCEEVVSFIGKRGAGLCRPRSETACFFHFFFFPSLTRRPGYSLHIVARQDFSSYHQVLWGSRTLPLSYLFSLWRETGTGHGYKTNLYNYQDRWPVLVLEC